MVAAHDSSIDMKGLSVHLKAGSGNLRGGDQAVMEALLGAKKGAVNLFSILNDTEKKVTLLMDSRLMESSDLIAFHPMQNDATTAISNADMKKIIKLANRDPEVINFSAMVTASAVPKEEKKVEAKA